MKSILVNIKNKMLLQSIDLALKRTGDFQITIDSTEDTKEIIDRCIKNKYDILFMDVARSYPYGFEERKNIIMSIKMLLIKTKIVLFCDSNSTPNIADKVKDLKSLNIIDAFFYESVNDKYMIAVLESL